MKRGYLPDQRYIQQILDAAEQGDADALAEARQLSAVLAKRANSRLSDLEKADYESSPAYIRVRVMVGEDRRRIRFRESKKLSLDELEEQLDELSAFLRDETSKVSAERFRRTGVEKMFAEGTIEAEDPDRTGRTLAEFLSTSEWKNYKATAGYIKGTMQSVVDAIENGASLKDLNRAYKNWRARYRYAVKHEKEIKFDLIERWEQM